MTRSLLLSRSGPVGRITLNRPAQLNALDLAGWLDLGRMVTELGADPDIRVLVIDSTGSRAFCAGADIGEFETTFATPENAARFASGFASAIDAIQSLAKPVIAEIDGVCVGGGCALAMACDLRYASSGSRLAITPTKIGAVYSFGDTNRLVQLVGPALAKEMLFFAETITAQRAADTGLLNAHMPAADLPGFVLERAEKLARLPRNSLDLAKQTVNRIVAGHTDAGALLTARMADVFSSPDFREGYSAFLEKRPPSFP